MRFYFGNPKLKRLSYLNDFVEANPEAIILMGSTIDEDPINGKTVEPNVYYSKTTHSTSKTKRTRNYKYTTHFCMAKPFKKHDKRVDKLIEKCKSVGLIVKPVRLSEYLVDAHSFRFIERDEVKFYQVRVLKQLLEEDDDNFATLKEAQRVAYQEAKDLLAGAEEALASAKRRVSIRKKLVKKMQKLIEEASNE